MRLGFWNGKKVLITGHTGFKGSWLALWLKTLGANVIGFSLEPPTEPNLFNSASVFNGILSIHGDIVESEKIHKVILDHQPEFVFHMAAQSLVRRSYDYPVETFATNVMGTVNVLEAVRKSRGVHVALIITSDKCYENQNWHWGYREIDPMGGADPYSSSKGCAELVTAAYRRSFFFSANDSKQTAISSVRAGNVIGGGDWATDRLVPDIIRAFIADRPVSIRYPNAIRPWQHVLDPLAGYLALAELMWDKGESYTGGWNFGPRDVDVKPVAWIVESLVELWGGNASWVTDNSLQPHEATYLKLDCSKANSCLAWYPRIDLHTALKWVVEWYQAFQKGVDMEHFSIEQIGKFERKIRFDQTGKDENDI